MTSGYFQDGGPLIARPSPPSKMATESNFPPGQGTLVDVKIPTLVELHEVKFPWVAPPPPILGQTIDRCIKPQKHSTFTSSAGLRVLAAQELLAPLLARALFLGCTALVC